MSNQAEYLILLDLDVLAIKNTNVRRTYVIDVKQDARQGNDLLKAVVFAREKFLEELNRNGYDTLLQERWVFSPPSSKRVLGF